MRPWGQGRVGGWLDAIAVGGESSLREMPVGEKTRE